MVSKSEQVAGLLQKIELGWSIPAPLEQGDLLEQGMHAVLQRHFDAKKAAATIKNLKAYYPDWNELRVSQTQEIVAAGKLGARGAQAARDVRDYLQEVFQHSHGLSLEFLREDPQATARFASSVSFLGLGTVHYLMWLAQQGELPVTGGLVRVLDRLGLVPRTASLKKAREALKPVIPAKSGAENVELEFAVRLGEVGSRWCDARKPLCHLCVLVEDCRHGKKVYKDWKVQQQRLEAQRAREAARMEALRLKEQAKAEREAERARRKAAAEEQKRQRERERQEKIAQKKRQAEEKQRARAEGAKKREEEAKKREQQKLAREKAERERKKAAAQKAAAKKPAKKPAPSAANKKGGARKPAAAGRKR